MLGRCNISSSANSGTENRLGIRSGGRWVLVTRLHNEWYLAHTLEVVSICPNATSICPGVFATDGPAEVKLLQVIRPSAVRLKRISLN